MLITRKNIRGGRALKTFPLVEENGQLGFQIGYCGCGCNEKLLIRTTDCQEILAHLFHSQKQYKNLIGNLTPKTSLNLRITKWLVGRLGEYEINENKTVLNF